MQCGFFLQRDYDAIFLREEKKRKKKVISTKLSLHSPSSVFKASNALKLNYFYRFIILSMQDNKTFTLFFLYQVTGGSSNTFTEIH